MKNDVEYLSHSQVMTLLCAIGQIRKSNPYFSCGITDNFEKYVLDRAAEIAMCSPVKLKLKPSASKYIVPKSMVTYLIRLTGTDIFDSKVLAEYAVLVNEAEETGKEKLLKSDSQKKL